MVAPLSPFSSRPAPPDPTDPRCAVVLLLCSRRVRSSVRSVLARSGLCMADLFYLVGDDHLPAFRDRNVTASVRPGQLAQHGVSRVRLPPA